MYGYFNYHLFRVKGMELNWDCGSLSTVDFKDSTLSNQSFQRDAAPKYGSLVLNLAPYYCSHILCRHFKIYVFPGTRTLKLSFPHVNVTLTSQMYTFSPNHLKIFTFHLISFL